MTQNPLYKLELEVTAERIDQKPRERKYLFSGARIEGWVAHFLSLTRPRSPHALREARALFLALPSKGEPDQSLNFAASALRIRKNPGWPPRHVGRAFEPEYG